MDFLTENFTLLLDYRLICCTDVVKHNLSIKTALAIKYLSSSTVINQGLLAQKNVLLAKGPRHVQKFK